MKALILDVMGVLIDQDSLLNYEEFVKICDDLKAKGEFIVLYSSATSRVIDYDPLHEFAQRYVDDGYFADNGKPMKPTKESFQEILSLHSLKPEECLYIDDGKANIEIAEKLGFHTIFYTNPIDVIDKLKKKIDEIEG